MHSVQSEPETITNDRAEAILVRLPILGPAERAWHRLLVDDDPAEDGYHWYGRLSG